MTIARRLWTGAALMLTAIAVLSSLIFIEFTLSGETTDTAVRANNILASADDVLTEIKDAEANQRGFLLTGRDEYLIPYNEAVSVLYKKLGVLHQTIVGDNRLEQQVEVLRGLIERKLNELGEAIRLRRNSELNASRDTIISDQKTGLMDQIHQIITTIVNDEESVLTAARSVQGERRKSIEILVVLGGPFLGLLILLIVHNVLRSIRNPLARLTAGIRDIGDGDLSHTVEVPHGTEFSAFADTFNRMIGLLSTERETRFATEQRLEDANRELQYHAQRLEKHTRVTEELSRLIHRMQGCRNEVELAEVVQCFVPQILPGVPGKLFVMGNSQNVLRAVASWTDPRASSNELGPDDCWGLRRGRAHLNRGAGSDIICPHVDASFAMGYRCVPLVAQGDTVGLLYIEWPMIAAAEDSLVDDGTVIEGLAENIALALVNIRLRDTLRNQSIRDPLTNLFNRRYLHESFELDLARANRSKAPLACIMIDVDHFKRFNDTYGHDAGDAVLCHLGELLRSHVRKGDVACRYGGEEFTLLLPGAAMKDAVERANAIRLAAQGLVITHKDRSIGQITLSLGVACYPENGETPETLISAADAALLCAKQLGRNRTIQAHESINVG